MNSLKRLTGIIGVAFATLGSQTAGAQQPDGSSASNPFPICIFSGSCSSTSTTTAPSNAAANLVTERPENPGLLDVDKFYVLKITCSFHAPPVQIRNRLLSENTTASTESIWIGNVGDPLIGAPGGTVPSTAVAVIPFASAAVVNGTIQVSKAASVCSRPIVVQGQSSIVNVVYGETDSNRLSELGNALYTALNLSAGIGTAFAGSPAAKQIFSATTAAAGTEDSIKALIVSAQRLPFIQTYPLPIGVTRQPIRISSPLGDIFISAIELKDLNSQLSKDSRLRADFKAKLSSLFPISKDAAPGQCSNFRSLLKQNNGFDQTDKAYIMGYLAQSLYPSRDDKYPRMQCIQEPDWVKAVLSYEYNKQLGQQPAQDGLNANDVAGYLAGASADTPLHPPSAQTRPIAGRLAAQMAIYATSGAPTGFPAVQVVDDSGLFFPAPQQVAIEKVVDALKNSGGKYVRFGCVFDDPKVQSSSYQGDAIILALPAKSSSLGTDHGLEQFSTAELTGLIVTFSGSPAGLVPSKIIIDGGAADFAAAGIVNLCHDNRIILVPPKATSS